MDEENQYIEVSKRKELNKIIVYPIMTVCVMWGVVVLLSALMSAADVFNQSLGLGLVLFLTGLGFIIYGIPVYIAFSVPFFGIEEAEKKDTVLKRYGTFLLWSLGYGIGGSLVIGTLVNVIIAFMLY